MPQIKLLDMAMNVVDQGVGSPLLLVHGFPLDHTMWQAQIDAFSGSHRVIAPDLRGFGGSGDTLDAVAPGAAITMEQFADDLAALLQELQVVGPVTYCGLSMGGYVGWQFFRRHRGKVAKLILCDTKVAGDTAEAAASRRKLAEKTLQDGAVVVAEGMLPKLFAKNTVAEQPQVVQATREVMLRTSPRAIAAALLGMAQRSDATSWLGAIDVPTLVIVGQEDAITTPTEMRTMAEAIPRAQFVAVPGAGHMAPLERPAPVNEAIAAFLGRP